jgi:hypothetical protein
MQKECRHHRLGFLGTHLWCAEVYWGMLWGSTERKERKQYWAEAAACAGVSSAKSYRGSKDG